jgi:hypothetical protein
LADLFFTTRDPTRCVNSMKLQKMMEKHGQPTMISLT